MSLVEYLTFRPFKCHLTSGVTILAKVKLLSSQIVLTFIDKWMKVLQSGFQTFGHTSQVIGGDVVLIGGFFANNNYMFHPFEGNNSL
jgi:hypothetical protein